MSPALGGAGRANFALRVALLSLAAVVVGCSANPASGALKVEVILEAGLISRCVKVTATDGVLSRETKAIPLAGKSSPLNVGVTADGMTQPVSVQALGYSDEACTTRAPGEESEKKDGSFTNPPSTVTLTLRPAANGDGGTDGGNDGGTDAGVDGGVDAGIDVDMDGFPLPDDCDDTDPLIHPGVAENCADGVDNNCDNQTDCQANSCSTMACAGGGTCMGNVCVALTESLCNDNVDNNNNGLVDCADPDCPVNQICSDNNACTVGDRCVVNPDGGAAGICQKVGDFACMTPPAAQCWAMTGTCVADGGATCVYTQMAGSCNDGLGCTDTDTCSSGTCSGTPKACPSPMNSCLSAVGTCQEPSGTCFYSPVMAGTGSCSDNNNCTTMDRCDGDGGCAGTPVTCAPPTQCQNASTSCDMSGNCIYAPRTGQACDAGTGAGTCDGTAACNPNPTTLFPTPPSNFNESQLPADGGTTGFNVTCNTTLTTGGTAAVTPGCVTMPAHVVLTSQTTASEPTLLIRVPSLTIATGQTLTIDGTRPVIFAVTGNVSINGTIRLNNPGAPGACGGGNNGTSKCGGGGGGFGTAGTTGGTSDVGTAGGGGGQNGGAALTPLRGGCSGGNGAGTGGEGGAGGGSIQIVASGTITISNTGVIAAPGEGGTQPTGNDVGGGGGGSGGAILLEAPTITMTGNPKLTANGGSGSSGADGNTDGTAGKTGNTTSSAVVTGGAAANTGTGGSGGAGTTAPTVGANDDNDGAGGGGGAVGRIRLNATTCTGGNGAVISPPHTGTTCP